MENKASNKKELTPEQEKIAKKLESACWGLFTTERNNKVPWR